MLGTNILMLFLLTSAGALMHEMYSFIRLGVSQCQDQNGLFPL